MPPPVATPPPARLAPWVLAAALVLLQLLLAAPTVRGHGAGTSLCARCESAEVAALRRYYMALKFQNTMMKVSFPGFMVNLLEQMAELPALAALRVELLAVITRYDDCMRTCEIAFTKRQATHSSKGRSLLERLLDSGRVDAAMAPYYGKATFSVWYLADQLSKERAPAAAVAASADITAHSEAR